MYDFAANTGDAGKFGALAAKAKDNAKEAAIILMADNPEVLAEGIKACKEAKPLLYAATVDNADTMASANPVAADSTGININLPATP